MLWIMLKNNFKLMIRNKLVVLLAVFGPVIVIAALTSAFHDLLNTGYDKEGFTLGYAIEEDATMSAYQDKWLQTLEEEDVTCKSYPANLADSVVKDDKVDVFIHATKDGYTLYSSKVDGVECRICRYAINQFDENAKIQEIAGNVQQPVTVDIPEETLPTVKTASASDYYGIIEMVYFIWICMIFLSPVIQGERKNRIQARLMTSPASNLKLYLGKFIPCALSGAVCIAVSILISTLLFDVHWGNYGMSAVILLLCALAATAFGLFCIYIVKNLGVSVVILFVVTWVAGYVGGSFETYMFSTMPDTIKQLSPIYYANRALVEYSTAGKSDYTLPCILFLSGVTLVFGVLGLLLMKRRMEER